jgi:hypothetical protein
MGRAGVGDSIFIALLRPWMSKEARADQKRQRETKWMVLTKGNGLPLAVLLDSAQQAEIQMAQETWCWSEFPRMVQGIPKLGPKDWWQIEAMTVRPFEPNPGAEASVLAS